MAPYGYFPILKTTDAELNGYREVDASVRKNILPVFELTRSRRSSLNPDANIWKRIEAIREIVSASPFILDLTIETTLSNAQISEMLNIPARGFERWTEFVKEVSSKGLNPIPAIHYNPNELKDVRAQIRTLAREFANLAFRASPDDAIDYVDKILSELDASRLILILDGGYLPPSKSSGDYSALFESSLNALPSSISKCNTRRSRHPLS